MKLKLKNDLLNIEIDTNGAELQSIKTVSDGHEYLWQGDANSWGKSAPILFPIVGAINNDRYVYNETSYNMAQHGFARSMDFEVICQSENKILLSIQDTTETRKVFPFNFQLILGYEITGNSLKVSYEVINKSEDSILFSIGAHPGFNCPLEDGLKYSDYKLLFNHDEHSERRFKQGSVLSGVKEKFFTGNRDINLDHSLFKDGALIFDDLKSTSITLLSDKADKKVKMDYDGFPYFGIWSWPQNPANFICLEPWYGIDSTDGDVPAWDKKEGLVTLDKGKIFKTFYTLNID